MLFQKKLAVTLLALLLVSLAFGRQTEKERELKSYYYYYGNSYYYYSSSYYYYNSNYYYYSSYDYYDYYYYSSYNYFNPAPVIIPCFLIFFFSIFFSCFAC
jgi:hypothetical protein